jgi:hypothetical protein
MNATTVSQHHAAAEEIIRRIPTAPESLQVELRNRLALHLSAIKTPGMVDVISPRLLRMPGAHLAIR